MPEPQLRIATPDDLDRLAELWGQLIADQNRYTRSVQRTKANRARMRQHLEKLLPPKQVLVLDTPDGPMGFAAVVVNPARLDMFYASAAISDLYVAPAYRGQGWGKHLLQAAVAMIRERGLHAATITVAAGNDAARELYRALGFEPMTETFLLPLDPEHARFGPAHPEA